jgi:transcriptional regulator with XRE-family HTH domain
MERLLRGRELRGLTYRELSEESGIPIPTLSWWSRKLEREETASAGACELVAVEVVEDELEEQGATIEIVVGDKLRLLVPPTASEGQLRRALRAIASC